MFTEYEFETIKKEFNEKQNLRRRKLKNIWGILLFSFSVMLIVGIILFQRYASDDEIAWIFYFFIGTTVLIMGIGLLVSMTYVSSKPYFEYIFPSIIQKINDEEGLFLTYQPYLKLDKTFNEKGGLFTRYASLSTKRCVKGYASDQQAYQICDCVMTTSSGNSQVTHFDGSYIFLEKEGQTELQIRTTGRPKLKGVKYKKVDHGSQLKIYKPREQEFNIIDKKYLELMESIKKDERYRQLYLSVNKEGMHLALWYKKHPLRKKKPLSKSLLNQYQNDFMNEINYVYKLEAIDHTI
jgi:hypothetical protein